MAKKKDKAVNPFDNNENEEKGGGVSTAIWVTLTVVLWLLIFGLLIKMDVGGIGNDILRPLIKDVPVLNWILPQVSDEQLIWEENYPYRDIKEAVDIIKELELQVEQLQEANSAYPGQIAELTAEVERLKVFEDEQLAFEERVRDFDINVVFNSQAPDIEEYKRFYEGINPETAEEIYRQVIEQLQFDEAIKQKANLLKSMKPGTAAEVLQEMTADIEWICKVLLSMKTDEATEIMNKMEPLFIARILQTMQDMDNERMESIQNNLIN